MIKIFGIKSFSSSGCLVIGNPNSPYQARQSDKVSDFFIIN